MNNVLAFEPGTTFNAGAEEKDCSKISRDGRALYLDALPYDEIAKFFITQNPINGMDFDELTKLLATILDYCDTHPNKRPFLFGTLSHLLIGVGEGNSPHSFSEAAEWFCQTLAAVVFDRLIQRYRKHHRNRARRYDYPHMTNDQFVYWRSKQYAEEDKRTEEFIDMFERVKTIYSEEPWPPWAQIRSSDMRSQYWNWHLENLQPDKKRLASSKKAKENEKEKEAEEPSALGPEHAPNDPALHARFRAKAGAAIARRSVFITRRGWIGFGPEWLTEGDTVMLVCGAPVPFAFTKFRAELRRRERDLRAAMDDNENSYYEQVQKQPENRESTTPVRPKTQMLRPLEAMREKRSIGKMKRLDEGWVEIHRILHELSYSNQNLDAWVLQGELHIEGIMNGEAMVGIATEKIIII
jgi:hypothetical protein